MAINRQTKTYAQQAVFTKNGLTVETSTSATWQLWFRLTINNLALVLNFNILKNTGLQLWADDFQIPNNAKPCSLWATRFETPEVQKRKCQAANYSQTGFAGNIILLVWEILMQDKMQSANCFRAFGANRILLV